MCWLPRENQPGLAGEHFSRVEGCQVDSFCFSVDARPGNTLFRSRFVLLYTSIKRLPVNRSISSYIRVPAAPSPSTEFSRCLSASSTDINPEIYSSLSHFPAVTRAEAVKVYCRTSLCRESYFRGVFGDRGGSFTD